MPTQHRRRTRTRRRRRRRRKNRNLFTSKRNNIAYSLKRGRGGGHDPYPTFKSVKPPFISRIADQTPEHREAVQQYEAAKNKYYQDLAKWRARREQILGRPLTFDEMFGKFGTVSVFPVPA
jgi:hypothetical protein